MVTCTIRGPSLSPSGDSLSDAGEGAGKIGVIRHRYQAVQGRDREGAFLRDWSRLSRSAPPEARKGLITPLTPNGFARQQADLARPYVAGLPMPLRYGP